MHGAGLLIPGYPLPIGVRRTIVVGGGGPTFPLDGVANVTGAWSMSRALLSAYAGSLYTDAGGGAISVIFQQVGADVDQRLTDGGTSTRRPALVTAGPNSREMADFDGSTDTLLTVDAISNFITASEGVIILAGIIDAYTLNNGVLPYGNDLLIGDNGQFVGLYGRNDSGGTIYAYNWDGDSDADAATGVATATPVVLWWRHKSGNVYVGVNGVEGAGDASGNTTSLVGTLRIGGFNASQFASFKFSEAATLSADPGAVTLAAIAADLLAHM